MPKGFKRLSELVPMADIKKALALMRFRTTEPTKDSLAYATITQCAKILKISTYKTHQLLKSIVSDGVSQLERN